ncbi:YfeK family protein [Lysobacter sp. HA18]
MRRIVLSVVLSAIASTAFAAPPPAVQHEITQLFDALDHSGCRFNRNGSWYDAHKARAHLQDKYDYLVRRDAIASTESFIDLAASKSSMTGRAYLVQCPDSPEVQSGTWFRRLLTGLRAKH